MNFDSLQKIIGAAGVKAAAAVGTTDEFKHWIEKFLVKADSKINDSAEAVTD